nr:hypothetical protein [Tanacetum cinerariifolium]
MIVAGADNRPPMLKKSMKDSWKIRMLLYIQVKEHGRMIHDSVLDDPLVWSTIEVDGVINQRLMKNYSRNKYFKLIVILKPPTLFFKQPKAVEMALIAMIREVAEEGHSTLLNSHVKTAGHDAAYGMTWKTLKKMMTNKYCPRSEIKKLEIEIWNLKESDEVEKYVGGLPYMIQGSVMASKQKTMQEEIKFTTKLMDQKIHTFAERQAENKRKLNNNSSDNNIQQSPFKRQNVTRAYSTGPSEKKKYAVTLPLCNKCKLHHNGQ